MQLEQLLNSPVRIHVSATGSGAGVQRELWGVPGCSSFFVGAVFTYSHEEQEEFLGFKPANVCVETAMDMAMRSYMRACRNVGERKPIGLGMTTSVASLKEHRGDHRIHAALVADDQIFMITYVLEKNSGGLARGRDGMITDLLGLNMLMFATNPQIEAPMAKFEDGTDLARKRLFEHPLFKADGSRQPCPEPGNGPGLVLYPGAFNPPHPGHLASGHEAIFHITADPPHKERLTVQQMLRRTVLLRGHDVLFTEGDPLYIDKARRFPGCHFVIGADALIRMLDPKWGIPVEPLLQEFAALNVSFEIWPRMVNGSIVTLFDIPIPAPFDNMFQAVEDTRYADLSSTQLRERSHGA